MFYAQFVLSKKGPLAKIWLAAHWERKLSKAQIFETNVQDAVDEILKPKVKLSLRTTGHLLLGIVRIYSRKAKYVLADCNEAFIKIKMAFKNDMGREIGFYNPSEERETRDLADVNFDDAPLVDMNDFDYAPQHIAQQAHVDDITLKDDHLETASLTGLSFNGDIGMDDFGEREASVALEDDLELSAEQARRGTFGSDRNASHHRDQLDIALHDSAHKGAAAAGGMDDDFGAGDFDDFGTAEDLDMMFDENQLNQLQAAPGEGMEVEEGNALTPIHNIPPYQQTQDSFVLEPLDAATLQNLEKPHAPRQRRKRKLAVDEQKNISGEDMKANMADYSDTIQPLDLAPPTKQLMKLKESGAADKLFTTPGCSALQDANILRLYQSHLVPHARIVNKDFAEQVRRDLDLVENPEDFNQDDFDDFGGAPSPMPTGMEAEAEVDENQKPEEPPVPEVSPGKEERRSGRKSKAHEVAEEEEEEDEQVFTRRTINVLHSVSMKLKANNDKIKFDDLLTKGSTRKTAAQKFYALLELRKSQAIEVEQSEPYGTILISSGPQMETVLEAH